MTSDDIEPAQPTWRRPRRWPFVLLALAVLLVLALAWAGTYANSIWYDSVGYGDVYTTLALTKAGLFLGTAVLVAFTMASSIVMAARRRPAEVAAGSWVERYRAYAEPVRMWLWICLTAIASLALAGAETGRWRDLLLWWQGGHFGAEDPWFHHDVGFYVFILPWWHDIVDMGLTLGLLALATSVAAHYFYGGITVSPTLSWTRAAQRQLAVIGAFTLVFKAGDYWLARYDAVHAGGPYATGVAYVDQHASVPGREVLAYAALICAGLLLWQLRRPRWRTPAVAVTLLFVSSIVLTLIWPAILQSSVVRANPIGYERDNLTDSIAATRTAYGLDHLTTGSLGKTSGDLDSLPLLDAGEVRTEIQIHDAAKASAPELDRYQIAGRIRPVLVSLAQRGGVGTVVGAYADGRDRSGKPHLVTSWAQDEVIHDLSPSDAPLYIGPSATGGVVAAGSAPGIALTGMHRFAYALANGNLDLLSKHGTLTLRLDPIQRANQIAPWLQLDQHPYLTVVGGRALWVIDSYTMTGEYPGSSANSWSSMTSDGSPGSGSPYDTVNYVRNAVKVTVDAQTGAVRLYEWDADPILHAWEGIFPGLVHARAEIPAELVAHLRYPTDLFAAQRFQAQTYASATPESLLGSLAISIPTVGDGTALAPPQRAMIDGVWSVLSPMSASNGHDLAAVLVADSDATSADYGHLRWLVPTAATAGPAVVNAIMRADPHVRAVISSLPTSATATWAPLVFKPSSAAPIWIAALYAVSSDTTSAPALLDVVVSDGGSVGIAPTLSDALARAAKARSDRAPTAAVLVRDANQLLARSRDVALSPDDRDALVRQAQAELIAAAEVLRTSK